MIEGIMQAGKVLKAPRALGAIGGAVVGGAGGAAVGGKDNAGTGATIGAAAGAAAGFAGGPALRNLFRGGTGKEIAGKVVKETGAVTNAVEGKPGQAMQGLLQNKTAPTSTVQETMQKARENPILKLNTPVTQKQQIAAPSATTAAPAAGNYGPYKAGPQMPSYTPPAAPAAATTVTPPNARYKAAPQTSKYETTGETAKLRTAAEKEKNTIRPHGHPPVTTAQEAFAAHMKKQGNLGFVKISSHSPEFILGALKNRQAAEKGMTVVDRAVSTQQTSNTLANIHDMANKASAKVVAKGTGAKALQEASTIRSQHETIADTMRQVRGGTSPDAAMKKLPKDRPKLPSQAPEGWVPSSAAKTTTTNAASTAAETAKPTFKEQVRSKLPSAGKSTAIGAGVGALAGATTGEDSNAKVQNALLGAAVGAGVGYGGQKAVKHFTK